MKERGKKFIFQILFIYLPLLILTYISVLYGLIRYAATRDDAQKADVIIVFGAAQYNGRPSPVYRARLDHTATLFRNNYAHRIVTTGGHGLDARFTEAEVGKKYLVKQNIPADCILTEQSGLTTLESVEKILAFLKLQNMNEVIAVSDGFHLFRIKQIFHDNRIVAYGSPVKNSPIESNFRSRVWASLREVFVYTAYLAQRKLHLPIRAGDLS
jgi:uncharacterized SAM-binding protein YcdF (DUF218 family)